VSKPSKICNRAEDWILKKEKALKLKKYKRLKNYSIKNMKTKNIVYINCQNTDAAIVTQEV
jgi:hypothetical protein